MSREQSPEADPAAKRNLCVNVTPVAHDTWQQVVAGQRLNTKMLLEAMGYPGVLEELPHMGTIVENAKEIDALRRKRARPSTEKPAINVALTETAHGTLNDVAKTQTISLSLLLETLGQPDTLAGLPHLEKIVADARQLDAHNRRHEEVPRAP